MSSQRWKGVPHGPGPTQARLGRVPTKPGPDDAELVPTGDPSCGTFFAPCYSRRTGASRVDRRFAFRVER